jgi:chromosome partitioning protein
MARPITGESTLLPYLDSSESTLVYAVRKTYWPNIDLIPACLALYEAEMAIAAHLATQTDLAKRVEFFSELKFGIQRALRCGALGFAAGAGFDLDQRVVGGRCAAGADGAANVRLHQHGAVLPHGSHYIGLIDPGKEYRWISVLTTLFDQRLVSHRQFFEVMKACFGDGIFQHVFFQSSEIINSAVQYLGSYEQPKPNRKVLEMLDGVFEEIELRVLREWPSKRAALLQKGIA